MAPPPPFFSPPRRCSLNKLCFSVRMTFSPQASEKTSASTADESAVGGGGGNTICEFITLIANVTAQTAKTTCLFDGWLGGCSRQDLRRRVGGVWCRKYGYLPPDSNAWLSLVLLCLLDCAASETYHYPPRSPAELFIGGVSRRASLFTVGSLTKLMAWLGPRQTPSKPVLCAALCLGLTPAAPHLTTNVKEYWFGFEWQSRPRDNVFVPPR